MPSDDEEEAAGGSSASVPRVRLKADEYAVVCYLRLHPAVAKTYGIASCSGKTTVGSMLLQTLESQGMGVELYKQLPNGVPADDYTKNQHGSKWIKDIKRRPGARMKQLSERPEVAPPDKAAIARHHGRLPKQFFPLISKLSRSRLLRTAQRARAAAADPRPPAHAQDLTVRYLTDVGRKRHWCLDACYNL
jgi:hypothetical protein